MTSTAITALCAVLTLVGLVAGWLIRTARERGSRDGKVDEILANLENLVTKHDDEIRELQRELYGAAISPSPRRPARQSGRDQWPRI